MKFDLVRLLGSAAALAELRARSKGLSVWITYLGADLNRHGGDWEELDRIAMPTRLVANGELVHDFIDPPASRISPADYRHTCQPRSQLLRM